ncbi:MAG: GIY-YIG nuclease family protein [Candidatus Hadarchaeia archaeon]
MPFYLYLLRLSDGSLYCGITNDVERRLKEHKNGYGSKYVKGRLPLDLVYLEEHDTRREAMRREEEVKSFSKDRKEELVEDWDESESEFSF